MTDRPEEQCWGPEKPNLAELAIAKQFEGIAEQLMQESLKSLMKRFPDFDPYEPTPQHVSWAFDRVRKSMKRYFAAGWHGIWLASLRFRQRAEMRALIHGKDDMVKRFREKYPKADESFEAALVQEGAISSARPRLRKLVQAICNYEGFGDPGQLESNVKIYNKLREDLDKALDEAIKELEK
jgi:hypothetical protein